VHELPKVFGMPIQDLHFAPCALRPPALLEECEHGSFDDAGAIAAHGIERLEGALLECDRRTHSHMTIVIRPQTARKSGFVQSARSTRSTGQDIEAAEALFEPTSCTVHETYVGWVNQSLRESMVASAGGAGGGSQLDRIIGPAFQTASTSRPNASQ
jgi:hypothetical protein